MARLALVMIARNEALNIGRCLESAKPYVDHMIVLDTGSKDETCVIAWGKGARVYHFEWIDDFSAARNAALGYSDDDWNLILDADEWIESGHEHLSPEILGTGPFIGVVPVDSRFDLQGREELSTSWIPRILPRGVTYSGRIHEQPVSDLVRKRLPLHIGHSGYKSDRSNARTERNISLLLRSLRENPANAYYMYQLGRTYEICGDFTGAVKYLGESFELSSPADSYRHDLLVRLIFSLKRARKYEEAVNLAEKEMANWSHSPDFFFAVGDLLLDVATYNRESNVRELLPMIESAWLRCLEIGDNPELDGSVKGRGSHLAAHNLSVLYEGTGNKEKAEYYRRMSEDMLKTKS